MTATLAIESGKLDDVVEQKYGNINLREVDLLPDM